MDPLSLKLRRAGTNEHEWLKSGSPKFVSIRVHSWFAILLLLLPIRDLWAEELGAISGRVLGPGGDGVALVQVSVISMESKKSAMGQSAVDGTYIVTGLMPGSYVVQASGDDPNYLARTRVRAEAGRETRDIDLKGGGLVLTGTATAGGERAVEGAFVTVTKTDFGNGEFLPTASARTAHTGADGRYRIEHLLPGNYTITVAGPGLGIRLFTNVTIEADAQQDVIFENVCFIAGRVVGPDGEPFKDAQLQAIRVEPSPVIRCFGTSDEDGLFRVENLGPGRYEVIAMGPGYQALVKTGVEIAAGATNQVGDLALTTGGGTVTGHVMYGPLPLPAIVVLKSDTSSLEYMTQASEKGVYEFSMVPPGAYHIDFSDPTAKPVPVTVAEGEKVIVDGSYYAP